MTAQLLELAQHYYKKYGVEISSADQFRRLYDGYAHQRELSVLDAVAATAAVNALFLSDQIDQSAITPQMRDAFGLAFPNRSIENLNGLSPESAKGWLGAWKGKLFEVEVRDRLNDGGRVGDIQLGLGQVAELADIPIQPGWDLQILNGDRSVATDLQLKATTSLSYVKRAIEENPDIDILATEEVASKMSEEIFNSGISNTELEAQVEKPMEELLDSPLEQTAEAVLPGLPFVLIATTEGRKVLMGRQTFQLALSRSVQRGVKTTAAAGAGALAILVGAGVISLPAAFASRMSIDRFTVYKGLSSRLESDIHSLRNLREGTL